MSELPFIPALQDTPPVIGTTDADILHSHVQSIQSLTEKYDNLVGESKATTHRRESLIHIDSDLTALELDVIRAIQSNLSRTRSMDPDAVQNLTDFAARYVSDVEVDYASQKRYPHLCRELSIRIGSAANQLVPEAASQLRRLDITYAPVSPKQLSLDVVGEHIRQLQAERDQRYPQDGSTLPLNVYRDNKDSIHMGIRKESTEHGIMFYAKPLAIGLTHPVIGARKPTEE